MTLIARPFRHFAPTPRTTSREWFIANIYTHEIDEAERPLGHPYDAAKYPHITAPGGPCDALDDPRVLLIVNQWGSRLGKTFFGQCTSLYKADTAPGPMMLAGPDRKLATEVVARTYGMIANCRRLRPHLRKKHLRKQERIDFERCKQYVAWSRSVSTLADKAVQWGHGTEIDKWEHKGASGGDSKKHTAKEADPWKLFLDRGKEFRRRKFIGDSTPTVKGLSRIERALLQSTNCRLHVPCPHCQKYQRLDMGGKDTKHGIKWEKNEAGKSDKDLARKTAHYVCQHCEEKIRDEHRPNMMRRGVWVPEGCEVKHEEATKLFEPGGSKPWAGWSLASWIDGAPVRDGSDAGYQLSSLYALTLTWGDIAAEFVGCQGKPQDLRNFINQWLGETWEIHKHQTTWQQLGERIIDRDLQRGVVPDWASVLTAGADKQGDKFVWELSAWGEGRRNHTVAYGECEDLSWFVDNILRVHWHKQGGGSLLPSFALVDSGFRTAGVYELCRDVLQKGIQLWPCKGAGRSLDVDFQIATLGKDTLMQGMHLFHVDTLRTQAWIDRAIHSLKRDDVGSISLHAGGLEEHQDFLEQLLNDAVVEEFDKSNNLRENWERINTAIPNDFRDCKRYSFVAFLFVTRGGIVTPAPPQVKRQAAAVPTQSWRRW